MREPIRLVTAVICAYFLKCALMRLILQELPDVCVGLGLNTKRCIRTVGNINYIAHATRNTDEREFPLALWISVQIWG